MNRFLPGTSATILAALAVSANMMSSTAFATTESVSTPSKGKAMTQQATGPFDVKMIPQPADPAAAGETIGRMVLDKKYHGALEAVGKGQMLAMRTAVAGSAGYVAMELITGKLDGRSGSFAVQHTGSMNRGAATMVLAIVPDSGTGELTGLTGTMEINVAEGGKHSYKLDYLLPKAP